MDVWSEPITVQNQTPVVHRYFTPPTVTRTSSKLIGVPICPDLLSYADLGAADNLRGRVVRAFFWLIRRWH